MEQPLVERIVKSLFPELEMEIISFEELPRQRLNESQEWVPDSPSYFIGVRINEYPTPVLNISEIVSLYTGCEFNIFRA
jgi:hypothetical protein